MWLITQLTDIAPLVLVAFWATSRNRPQLNLSQINFPSQNFSKHFWHLNFQTKFLPPKFPNSKSKGIHFPKSRFWNPRKFLNHLRVSKSFEHHSLTANSKSSCAKAQKSLRILSVGDFDNWETKIVISPSQIKDDHFHQK
jgi:hypothetical protein